MQIGENNSIFMNATLSKDDILSIKNKDENFIPIQQILNNKVKLTCTDKPEIAGNYGVFKADEQLKNISLIYRNRTESALAGSSDNLLADFTQRKLYQQFLIPCSSKEQTMNFWKWFVILTLLFLVLEVLIQKFVKWI